MKKVLSCFSQLLAVAALVVAFSACSSKLNNENLTKVKNGMTMSQVKSILGKPDREETGTILDLKGTTFYYHRGDAKVQISFINDQVTMKIGSFGEVK